MNITKYYVNRICGSFFLPLTAALGSLAIVLFYKNLVWPLDLYLASAFINFYINPNTYSKHDILISGAGEIPFFLYQGLSRLLQNGHHTSGNFVLGGMRLFIDDLFKFMGHRLPHN